MSWSVFAHGRPKAVAESIATQAEYKCSEPEETIKQKVIEAIQLACANFPDGTAVSVTASGSQSVLDYNDPSKGMTNQLSVQISPLYNFLP